MSFTQRASPVLAVNLALALSSRINMNERVVGGGKKPPKKSAVYI
jgi:hypothetical protein